MSFFVKKPQTGEPQIGEPENEMTILIKKITYLSAVVTVPAILNSCMLFDKKTGPAFTVEKKHCIAPVARREARLYRAVFSSEILEGRFCLSHFDVSGEQNSCYRFYTRLEAYRVAKEKTILPQKSPQNGGKADDVYPQRIRHSQSNYYAEVKNDSLTVCNVDHSGCHSTGLGRVFTPGKFYGVPAQPLAVKSSSLNEWVVLDSGRAVLTSRGIVLPVGIYSLKGKRLREFHLKYISDLNASLFGVIGRYLYVRNCVGAGPGCSAEFYDLQTGQQRFKQLGQKLPNMYSGHELKLSGTRWLFVSGNGLHLTLLDTKKMTVIDELKIDEAADPSITAKVVMNQNHSELHIIAGAPYAGDLLKVMVTDRLKLKRYTAPVCAVH